MKSKQKSQEKTEKQKQKLHKLIFEGQATLEELKTFLEKKKELKELPPLRATTLKSPKLVFKRNIAEL